MYDWIYIFSGLPWSCWLLFQYDLFVDLLQTATLLQFFVLWIDNNLFFHLCDMNIHIEFFQFMVLPWVLVHFRVKVSFFCGITNHSFLSKDMKIDVILFQELTDYVLYFLLFTACFQFPTLPRICRFVVDGCIKFMIFK